MGHLTVLVIGDNFRDQLDKYQRMEYADPAENKHIVSVDVLAQAPAKYDKDMISFLKHKDMPLFLTHIGGTLHVSEDAKNWRAVSRNELSGEGLLLTTAGDHKWPLALTDFSPVDIPAKDLVSFPDWIKKRYGVPILGDGEKPDPVHKHWQGWVRLNHNGEVCEAIERTIPNGFHDRFEGTVHNFKLKPGASGIVIESNGKWGPRINPGENEFAATDGYAGSARKGSIDFDRMRAEVYEATAERWDFAMAACNSQTWEPYSAIWGRYSSGLPEPPKTSGKAVAEYSRHYEALESAAGREWSEQSAVKAIIAATRHKPFQWERLSRSQQNARSWYWSDLSAHAIDWLRLPRDQFLEKFGTSCRLGYCYVIRVGELLEGIPEKQLLDSIPEEAVMTLAYVHA